MNLGAMPTFPTSPEMLAVLAAKLQCRVYMGVNGPYLHRYTLCEFPDGDFLYLHFFARSDADLELHSHPWEGRGIILTGGYVEERRVGEPGSYSIVKRIYLPGDETTLAPGTFHRVDLLVPDRGCWTLFHAGARQKSWGFWDRDTGVFLEWDEFLEKRGLIKGLAT